MRKKLSMHKSLMIIFFIVFICFSSAINAQVIAVKAKKIYTVSHGIIENGVILIRDKKIEAVGTEMEVSWNADIVDFSQKIIVPGLVEAHAVRGYDIANETNPLTPFVTVFDSIDTSHDAFKTALRDGVTTLCVMPGNRTILGGIGIIVKPVGLVVEDMVLVPDAGMKVSVAGTGSQTRMGVMAQLRRYFNEAIEYMENKELEASKKNEEKMVSTPGSFRSPEYVKYESVADLLRGRYRAFVYCESPSDVIRAQKLAERFDFQSVYVLGPECYRAADFIQENKLRVVLDPEIVYFEKDPMTEKIKKVETAKVFHEKGVAFALQSDPAKVHTRSLFYQAMRAMSSGLNDTEVLESVTLIPAQILGMESLVGSIDKGKLANFVVLDDEPFRLSTKVEFVYIEGKLVYEREKDEQLKKLFREKIIR
ncbi:MAG: amidohydrolase family protein [Candidatus Aminicenantes bacterium]|nr:MAG: amidohydrolase family protein [Candidatus Aminicenantes bacterium]